MGLSITCIGDEKFVNEAIGRRVRITKTSPNISVFPIIAPILDELTGVIISANYHGFKFENEQGRMKCFWDQLIEFTD